MNKTTRKEKTRQNLIQYYQNYPNLQAEDIFKYLFQSAFGCEHLVSNEDAALNYIEREYATLSQTENPKIEPLDGDYSRVYLSHLNAGLTPKTLAKLFCLSAKKEEDGLALLEEKTEVARELVTSGVLPLDADVFHQKLATWKELGYPAVHHSEAFRTAYKPAYRVIANRYVAFLQVFAQIDKLLARGRTTASIEGGSAGGKTTLASVLQEVYDCNVLHMDDFFLRPEQRTQERLSEVGGNIDKERFLCEVIEPLNQSKTVCYRPFDCASQSLGEAITVVQKPLTVIEGVYSMHPAFGEYYGLAIFLDIDPTYQKERILRRNSPTVAKRFFEEWIPLENAYFEGMNVKERAHVVLPVVGQE